MRPDGDGSHSVSVLSIPVVQHLIANPHMPRVVVLSKRHRLTSYLVQQLARDGVLAGVVYEERFRTIPDTLRYLRRNAKREGLLHTADVLAYELYDRLFRRTAFLNGTARFLPLDGAETAAAGEAPVFVVEDHNAPSTQQLIASLEPDMLVVHACGILKEATFKLGRVAALNIHCGVLPEYRGHATTFWSLYRKDIQNVGVSVHLVAKTVDTGLPVGTARVRFTPSDDDMTMWFRAFREGVEIVRRAARAVQQQDAVPTQQYDGPSGPHYPRRGLTQYLRFRMSVLAGIRQTVIEEPLTQVSG